MTITNDLSNFGLMANAMYNSMTANATAITSMSVGIANSANLTTTTNVATIGTSAYFVANGNIGIGTSSPTGKLHVVGGSLTNGIGTFLNGGGGEGGEINILNPDNTTTGLIVDVAGTNLSRMFSTQNNMTMQIGQLSGTGGNIQLYTAASERVRIDSSGNVGINQTSPTARLDVSGGIRASGGATYGTGVCGYSFSSGDTDGGMFSPSDGTLVFATNNVERVRIDSLGNVGIGVTSPTYKLHVAGDVSAYRPGSPTTGVYYFGNGTNQYLYYDGTNYVLNSGSNFVLQNGTGIQAGNGEAGEKQLALSNNVRRVYFYLGSDGGNVGLWDVGLNGNRFYTASDAQFFFSNNLRLSEFASGGTYYTHALMGFPGNSQNYLRFYHQPGAEAGAQLIVNNQNVFTFRNDGYAFAVNWYSTSDTRIKSDQLTIENSLYKIQQLTGITYRLNNTTKIDGSPIVDAGLIAQDVQKVLPQCVEQLTKQSENDPDGEGLLSLNYNGVTALLVNAVKELNAKTDAALAAKDAEIEALKARLVALEKKLN
jgi:hypothetical protein